MKLKLRTESMCVMEILPYWHVSLNPVAGGHFQSWWKYMGGRGLMEIVLTEKRPIKHLLRLE
jgi:hypothetical protein